MTSYADLLTTIVWVTADVPINRETVKPGWVALGVVFAMGIALIFLLRSFVKHSRKAQDPWEGEETSDH